ncbi:hypothetical protein PQR71_42210, partial [Paraburkholderia fungorum]|uniref:hypothetical protein n=1 Tax=Paraburkholderia fungorum TaxID=134537 RepID=UPI0038BBEBA6
YVIQNGAPIPADTTTTVRNVSPGVLAAFSSSLNGFDCHYTKAGISGGVPGVGGAVQWNENDTDFCVKGWTQAELNRQSTITEDSKAKAALQQASTNVKCTLDDDIYRSLIAAGVACQTKPEDYDKRNPPIVTNTDGQKVQTALVYLKAQP